MTIEDFNHEIESVLFPLSSEQQNRFSAYCRLIQEWNEKMNLTAITETEEVYEKHFLDCAYALSEEVTGKVLDVGSGAGFPGIVWKILKPDLEITLLEPTQKRCRFLNAVIEELQLQKIEVVSRRAEEYITERREYYDTVTARAVADLSVLSELCLPFVRKGGYFAAMKGANAEEELQRAEKAIRILGGRVKRIEEKNLPSGSRKNIMIVKEKETDRKYPRRYDQIKKRPL